MTTPYRRLLIPLLFIATLAACGGGGGGGASAPSTPVVVFVDTDKDGVADSEDAAPADPLCAAASDASGGVCFLKTLASFPLKIVSSDGGKIVLRAEEDVPRLYLYDLKTRHFLGRGSINGYAPLNYAYSADHARLYVGDDTGKIHSYNEALQESAVPFAKLPLAVGGLAAVGKFLLAQDPSGAWATHYVYDKQGKLVDSKEWNYASSHYAWSAALSRVYFFRDGQSPNDLMFEVIDQTSGRITASGETPYHGAYSINGPIRVSQAGDKVLLGTGDIYHAPELAWVGNIGRAVTQAEWLANGEMVTLEAFNARTRLVRYMPDRSRAEEVLVDGTPLGVFAIGTSNFLVTKKAASLGITEYVPSDDTDGDGVANTVDKFPMDKTASVDTDNDGYPDAFLLNYGPADSPTGLVLDAYPKDPSCHLQADGDGTMCTASKNPAYIPDATGVDNLGNILLLSRAKKMVYRWSPDTNAYLTPIAIGTSFDGQGEVPTLMRSAGDHGRIYFGYASGLITFINLNGDTRETRLSATASAVHGLAIAGKFIVAQDDSGAWATHYVFDQQGLMRDSKDWNYYSRDYAWDRSKQRLYYFRDDTTPNDVMFEVIDQVTGKITSSGETPYHGDYQIAPPLRLSLYGDLLYTGSGIIYSTADMKFSRNALVTSMDAVWAPTLVTLSRTTNWSEVVIYNSESIPFSFPQYPGKPVALQISGTRVILISHDGDRPRFTVVPV